MSKMDRNFGRYRLTVFWKTSAPSYVNMCHQLHKNAAISYLKFVNVSVKLMQEKAQGKSLNSSQEEVVHGNTYFQCFMIKTLFTQY